MPHQVTLDTPLYEPTYRDRLLTGITGALVPLHSHVNGFRFLIDGDREARVVNVWHTIHPLLEDLGSFQYPSSPYQRKPGTLLHSCVQERDRHVRLCCQV